MKILLVALNSKYIHTNLAVRYIKTYCDNCDIDIKEYTINDSIGRIINEIYLSYADVIGFSCYIWNIETVLKIAGSIKKITPGVKILLGGPEVSYDSKMIMKDNPFIDYILSGEGEEGCRSLFSCLEHNIPDIGNINSLTYRKGDGIVENKKGTLIKDLDKIPFPYRGENACDFKNKIMYYETSRGCPFKCSYCLSSTIEGVCFFSLARTKRDLMWFIDNDVKLVKFVDRTFNCGKNYFDLLKFLIENKKNTRFHFEISGWILDDEVIKLINSAPYGLFQFEIGIQSTNQDTLDTVYRKADTGILFKNIKRLIQKGNAHIHLDLIAGLPKENISSFRMSFNDAFNLKPDMLQLGFLKLLKGSALRENAREYGIVYESYPPYEVLKTDAISFKELICLKNIADMVDAYYNSGRFDTILSYIVGAFGTPFDFFSKFAEYRSKKISMNIKIGNVQQYELIYDFCRGNGDININLAKECLAFDYLMQGRNTYMPDFIRPDVSVDKQYIWNFLSDRHNIEKYLPYYAGTSTKEIIKSICVKYFKYNIFKFVRHPAFNAEDCIVFFDYGHKDRYGRVKYFPVQK